MQKGWHPDWNCPQCGRQQIFGSKDKCPSCGCFRSKAFSRQAKPQAPSVKSGDWWCPSCKTHNFANKQACFKCKLAKPADERPEGSSCSICLALPSCMNVHVCGHISMCEACCGIVSQCPICRAEFDPLKKPVKMYIV